MNNKKRDIAIILSSLVVTSVIVFIVYKRQKNKKDIQMINDILDSKIKDPNASQSQNIISSAEYNSLPTGIFPLKFGDKNKKVYELQRLLNQNFGTSIDLDGKYGDSTFQAMCSKVWNSGILSLKYVDCYDTTLKGFARKVVSQIDFEKVKNYKR